jgi:hypothetical protein
MIENALMLQFFQALGTNITTSRLGYSEKFLKGFQSKNYIRREFFGKSLGG